MILERLISFEKVFNTNLHWKSKRGRNEDKETERRRMRR